MDTRHASVAATQDGPAGGGPAGGDPAAGGQDAGAVGSRVGETLTLRVNEIFGPTIQGEGPAAGRHCLFVRLAGCNLTCTWCDTAYTWAWTPELGAKLERPQVYDRTFNDRAMTIPAVLEQLNESWSLALRPTTIIVSGGEPLMQQPALIELARELTATGNAVHIETAGTIAPLPDLTVQVEQFVVSPKLAHSGNVLSKRIKPAVLERFAALGHRAMFKFVATDISDLDEIDALVTLHKIPPCRVQVMPEGTTVGVLLATGTAIADGVVGRGWGLSLRSHVLLWPKVTRGR